MTYTVETRPDTSKTKKLLKTTNMNILRRISGKTLMNKRKKEKETFLFSKSREIQFL